jgi:hypothetical protein|tara:strand:+ start:72 stop:1220 length:1149 start_codon:yes stop_codon:yes gene_type:complete
MNTKDQNNFLQLSIKGFKQMAKDVGKFDKTLEKLAKDAMIQGNKGYLTFMNWFQKLNRGDKLALAGELSYYTKQKDKTIEKMLKFKFESVELKSFSQITEAKDKGVTFTFGRFNPPTVGHMKLAAKMKSVSKGHDVHIYTSHTTDKKKNPLSNKQIRQFMNPMLPSGIDVQKTDARTVFDVATSLYDNGYRMIQMVVGSDRIREFDALLNKYNGVKARHGYYKFDSIKIISAGERDPDAKGDVGMSASKMRQFAHLGQEKEFVTALPRGYKLGKQLYKAVQKGMGIREDFPDYMYEVYNGEWGTDKGRAIAQKHTPGQSVVDYVRKIKEAEDLPKEVLLYKEKMYKELKKERADFVKKHGDKADSVMHATAMNMAKRKHGIN